MKYCIYLRKSRADLEAESHGEMETLARHEKILLDLARRQNLNVTAIYKEIVSGETITSRPVMQQLLQEVERGDWNGVIAIELERLARGDTIDQGVVAQAFKFSNTLIITPTKTYDPNNEFDEEYFEFGLFMSRREYKTINRRLQRGRLASVTEGNFIATFAPFGYDKIKLPDGRGFTLQPNDNADAVRLIFDLYVNERKGSSAIASILNVQGIKPAKSDRWVGVSIRDILSNPVYIGKIRWNWRAEQVKIENGKKVKTRPRNNDNPLIFEGKHEAIIAEDVFLTAEEIRKKTAITHESPSRELTNPLAGLIKCSECGRAMIRRPNSNGSATSLMCPAVGCKTIGNALDEVESEVVKALILWLDNYNISKKQKKSRDDNAKQVQIKSLEKSIQQAKKQKDSLYDLLEQGIYSTEVFLDRSEKLDNNLALLNSQLTEIKGKIDKTDFDILAPKIEVLLKEYSDADVKIRNQLLKTVIDKISYSKEKSSRWSDASFTLKITYKF